MIKPGDIISYLDMCREEKTSLQRGMNFRLHNGFSVIIMSLRRGAPYTDRIEGNGRVLIYEGHVAPGLQEAATERFDELVVPGRENRVVENIG